jgi:DNA-3-methyladenine glycosylase I
MRSASGTPCHDGTPEALGYRGDQGVKSDPIAHDGKTRCSWCGNDPLYRAYHDQQWGIPVSGERDLFEMLVLEGAQAGLSWLTILRKREGYRRAFDGFDPEIVARYDARRVERLLADPGIVRNRLKVESAVRNAGGVLALRKTHGGLPAFLWAFVGGAPRQNSWRALAEIPARTAESDAMSKALRALGFGFVGPTVCYAFMQAVGMVNDHTTDCHRHAEVAKLGRARRIGG